MNKLLLTVSLISLIGSNYFFFVKNSLLYGSLSLVVCFIVSVFYAMQTNVNVLTEDEMKNRNY